jgi:Mg-chelatase subunit ChlD
LEKGIVTILYPWVFIFLLLPAALLARQWSRAPRRLNLILKTLMLTAVILALSQPEMSIAENKVSTVVLVDTSAGVPPEDLARASETVTKIDHARGRNWIRVIPFARASRPLADGEQGRNWKIRRTAGESGQATDIEAAIRDGIASMPGGMVPRIVVISDGNENAGSVSRASWLARDLRIPVDTYALNGPPEPLLRVESVTLPSLAFSGEKFPLDLLISSPKKSAAAIELSAEGRKIGAQDVSLEQGVNYIRVHTAINVAGAVELSGVVRSTDAGEVRFERALTLRKPRVLFLSNDPPGTEKHLLDTLAAAQFTIDRSPNAMMPKLSDYQMVVFNNWDLESLPAARKDEMEDFVKQGGGLLVIGGERNVYREGKKVEDAMDRTLPAKLAPPRSPEGTCVVLIIDKSSSMEGRKMELARQAAIGVIENLRPIDQVGVLIFDNSFHWAVPIRRAEDRGTIKRLVAGITPDGGTQIAPALSEAYRKISVATATYRHVVLLTDGISEEGDSMNLARDAAARRVTISTVGLGQDVNRAYLEKVAASAKGRSYFLTDPSGLEQILLKDVMEHTGSTAIEKPISPVVVRQSAILEGVGMETAPPLRGYVKFVSKPGADMILKLEHEDPLLSVWQFGLGRSAVFTSDAKARWAEKWVEWSGFDKFWLNLFRDLLPHAETGESRVLYDSASGNLQVEYKLASQVQAPDRVPDIFVLGPNDFRQAVPVKKVSEGTYRGEVHIGARRGLFRVRPLEDSLFFPETGLYREEEEMTQYGSNALLLRSISQYTGGRFNPKPSQVFDSAGRSIPGSMRLWPGLLAIAIVLNLLELVIRKWEGIAAFFARPQAAPAS